MSETFCLEVGELWLPTLVNHFGKELLANVGQLLYRTFLSPLFFFLIEINASFGCSNPITFEYRSHKIVFKSFRPLLYLISVISVIFSNCLLKVELTNLIGI